MKAVLRLGGVDLLFLISLCSLITSQIDAANDIDFSPQGGGTVRLSEARLDFQEKEGDDLKLTSQVSPHLSD